MNKILTATFASLFLLTLGCESSKTPTPEPDTPASAQVKTPKVAASAPAANAGGVLVSGSIALPEGAAATGKAVFVSIRSLSGGPPLAAKRMAVGDFPMSFTLDSSNLVSMGGAAKPAPSEFNVKVTLDQDGNPMNKSPDDLSFVQKVKRGQKDVKMLLKKN